jgi:hypothetical protein
MRFVLYVLILCVISLSSWCQTNIGGTINSYTAVTGFSACTNKVTVADATGLMAGNHVIIIQMQGATIDETNTASFGTVSAYNSAGRWEKAVIAFVVGNEITFTKNLLNTYQLAGKVQVVSMPVYASATVTSTLTGSAWNGTTGGVIAMETPGDLTLNSDIDATGIGFRGGANTQVCPNNCNWFTTENAYYFATGNYRGAFKGEGIAAAIANKELGRGAQANGGGGGNDHNNGGAGGGNYVAGGQGGNNAEPGTFNCKGNNNYGRPGIAMNYTGLNKLYFGGGGGAGHGNNSLIGGCSGGGNSGAGGNGGGIVIIIAATITNNGATIRAAGSAGQIGNADAGGGGGAGGVVFLSASSYINNMTIDVRGGAGGNTTNFTGNRCFGPGGGGGAGIVMSTTALPVNVTTQMTGGAPGIVTESVNACNGTSNSAAAGVNTSAILSGASIIQGTVNPAFGCINNLPVTFVYFRGKLNENKQVLLEWATSFEQNALYYAIERSTNAVQYEEIGRVDAIGNTNNLTKYSFTDATPYAGKNYYRLKQVDWDGTAKYTSVIMVEWVIDKLIKAIYPNPVVNGTLLTLEIGDKVKNYHCMLTDMTGRVVWMQNKSSIAGSVEKIMLPELSTGVYLLTITSNGTKQVEKMQVY